MLFMFGEIGTEFLAEEGFFAAGLYVEGEPNNSHGKQPADCAESDGGPQKCKQDSSVDGMSNRAVGTGANELVAFFEGDDAAPIGAEMPARPESYADSGGGEENTKPFAEGPRGKEAMVQPTIERLRLIKEIKTNEKRKRVSETLKNGFALLGFLAFERGYEPIDAEEKPERLYPLAGGRKIHVALQNAAGRKMKQP